MQVRFMASCVTLRKCSCSYYQLIKQETLREKGQNDYKQRSNGQPQKKSLLSTSTLHQFTSFFSEFTSLFVLIIISSRICLVNSQSRRMRKLFTETVMYAFQLRLNLTQSLQQQHTKIPEKVKKTSQPVLHTNHNI